MDWTNILYITEIINTSYSYSEVLRKLSLKQYSVHRQKLQSFIIEHDINIGHFERGSTSGLWQEITRERLESIITTSTTKMEICGKLGLSKRGSTYKTIEKYINRYNISTDHLATGSTHPTRINRTKKITTSELLADNTTYSSSVKKRVIEENLIDYVCQSCGNVGMWQNHQLVLQLDHIDGNPHNNQLGNLRFLCPNCHSQTHNWGRKKR